MKSQAAITGSFCQWTGSYLNFELDKDFVAFYQVANEGFCQCKNFSLHPNPFKSKVTWFNLPFPKKKKKKYLSWTSQNFILISLDPHNIWIPKLGITYFSCFVHITCYVQTAESHNASM